MSTVTPCFTPGTLIATDKGARAIETLSRGDMVVTRDNGLRKIGWIGRRTFSYAEVNDAPELRPVLVRRDVFGEGNPARDMIVSPAHRFLISVDGEPEALVAVRELVDGVRVIEAPVLGVSYIHILCHAHEVILANGAWTESFHPDDQVVQDMADDQRAELLALYPEIATIGAARRFPAARPVISRSRFES
ncbi:MAG: Hint domain-containing protein [Pseudomonadota bacterium]